MRRITASPMKSDLSLRVNRASCRVAQLGHNYRFTMMEVERFISDISQASRRLVSREYQQSTFQPRNTLRIPDRTEELFSDLSFYWSVGQIWSSLARALSLRPDARIAEIGCGYVPKVAIGLHYLGVHGSVDLVDTDGVALQRASRFLELMGVRFPVGVVKATLFDEVNGGYDAIFANHLLDDLILNHHCESRGLDIRMLYAREARYAEVWGEIVADPHFLRELVPLIADALVRRVRPGGVALLLDYPSFTHRALGLTHVIDLVRQATRMLRDIVEARGATLITDLPSVPLTVDRVTVTRDDIVVFKKGGGDGGL